MKKVFVHCSQLEQFPYPDSSPFKTHRAGMVRKQLDSMGLLTDASREQVEPRQADRQLLEQFHTSDYLDTLIRANEGQFETDMLYMGLGTGDCPVFHGMYDYSVWAVGATVTGAEEIISGRADIAYNPSGGLHHAFPDRAGGFCYLNDVVLGCMTLAIAGKKVLFLDSVQHAPINNNCLVK